MEAASESQLTVPGRIGTRVRRFAQTTLPIVLALAAGLALRLWMLKEFFLADGDTLVYGGLAKNILLHGRYALTTGSGENYSTLIRLPGYPLFLAVCFRIFGMENYAAAVWAQIALELCSCLLLAAFAHRIAPAKLKAGSAIATLWLAALCPFTAVYAATPLTEAPTLFVIALALWAAARFNERPGWGNALIFTFAVSYAALLRPDGALVGVALAPALLVGLWRKVSKKDCAGAEAHGDVDGLSARLKSCPDTEPGASAACPERGSRARGFFALLSARLKPCPDTRRASKQVLAQPVKSCTDREPHLSAAWSNEKLLRMAVVCAVLALLPFGTWTWRNWRVFHVFEPLATRHATDPGEDTHPGWQRWIKTWCLDFTCTADVYWPVPGEPLALNKLPSRAFGSPAQYAETAALAKDYNGTGMGLTPGIDARFGRLAAERIASHPLRYYLWLPLGRVADMWLRPRVENLPIDLDWWVYAHHKAETRISWGYAALNALYLLLAVAGLWLRPRFWAWMLAYMLLRSALLLAVEAPETRYTLECFPMLFVLGGIAFYWFTMRVWRFVSRTNAFLGRG